MTSDLFRARGGLLGCCQVPQGTEADTCLQHLKLWTQPNGQGRHMFLQPSFIWDMLFHPQHLHCLGLAKTHSLFDFCHAILPFWQSQLTFPSIQANPVLKNTHTESGNTPETHQDRDCIGTTFYQQKLTLYYINKKPYAQGYGQKDVGKDTIHTVQPEGPMEETGSESHCYAKERGNTNQFTLVIYTVTPGDTHSEMTSYKHSLDI